MKIKLKLIFSFLLIYLATISIASSFYYYNARKALTEHIFMHLESVVENKQRRIESIINQNFQRLSLVSSRTQLRLSLRNHIRDGNPSDAIKMNRILADALSSIASFENISVINLKGKIVSSTNEQMIGIDTSEEEYFIRGKKGNVVDIFFLDDSDLKTYLSGPLYLEDRLLGVLVIKSGTESLLSAIRDYTGMGRTGETLMARKTPEGDALFLTPLRFDPDAALSRTIPRRETRKPIVQALAGNESFFEHAIDYRGREVLAATRYIEKMKWGVVAKIDTEEAFQPVVRLRYTLLLIILASSAIIITVSLYLAGTITRPLKELAVFAKKISTGNLSQRIEVTSRDEIGSLAVIFNEMAYNLEKQIAEQKKMSKQIEQELTERKKMEEQLLLVQASVDNAGESIFLIDRNAKFIQVNKAACISLGYTEEELLNMTVADVDPNFPVEKWPDHWEASKKSGFMSFESVHRHKSGRTFPVEVRVNYIQFENRAYNFAFATDITERKKSEEKLKASLEEKELLLREIHHRTKNNMQIISSLLSLQSEKVGDKHYHEIFLDSHNRIKTMALIHEKLYQSVDLANIDLNEYIKDIADNLFKTYSISLKKVSLKTEIEDISLGIDTAIPCGLIINELVSNSLKHAFPEDREGEIIVSFKHTPERRYLLTVKDNGIGLPEGLDVSSTKSLGLQLVKTLAESQLQGTLEFIREEGTLARISFREIRYKKRI